MKNAVELDVASLTVAATPAAYDPAKLTLNTGLVRQSDGGKSFFGPRPPGLLRPSEAFAIGASSVWMADVIRWSTDIDWVFFAENPSSAAATKVFNLAEYNRATQQFTAIGRVTATFPAATNHTVRGLRAMYDKITTGTVAVSGTAVTGSGTGWQTARANVGSRIGFGSTDPTQISTWYTISAIASDTGLTLAENAGTISAGTAFVIEDVMLAVSTTNATATNGGLFVIKGLKKEIFIHGSTVIPAATTIDNIRAVYWLKDADTVTNTVAGGLAMDDQVSRTSQDVYIVNGSSTSLTIFKYNVRAALTLTSGAATNAFLLVTGANTTVGNISQQNNGRIVTAQHGSGNGVKCLYLFTVTRLYRAPLANITSGATNCLADLMAEVPPGGTNTYPSLLNTINNVAYSSSLDMFMVSGTGTGGARMYLTRWRADGSQWDKLFGADGRVQNSTLADSNMPIVPGLRYAVNAGYLDFTDGILYLQSAVSTQAGGAVFAIDVRAEWDFASTTLQRAITPAMSTPGAVKLYKLYVAHQQVVGAGVHSFPTEPFRVYYRTSGISDNSGAWTAVPVDGDLSGVAASSQIQFMFEFLIFGMTMAPDKIYGLAVVYDADDALPAELRWNLADSDNANGTVGFKQTAAFGSLTSFTITYRRVDTDAVVLTQASTGTTNGVFEYWTGSAWAAGLGSDANGTRRRFRPTAGLPAGVNTYAKITKV